MNFFYVRRTIGKDHLRCFHSFSSCFYITVFKIEIFGSAALHAFQSKITPHFGNHRNYYDNDDKSHNRSQDLPCQKRYIGRVVHSTSYMISLGCEFWSQLFLPAENFADRPARRSAITFSIISTAGKTAALTIALNRISASSRSKTAGSHPTT